MTTLALAAAMWLVLGTVCYCWAIQELLRSFRIQEVRDTPEQAAEITDLVRKYQSGKMHYQDLLKLHERGGVFPND